MRFRTGKYGYYVYEHVRTDNNSVFYVGMGSGLRAWEASRNPVHDVLIKDLIANGYGWYPRIVKEDITEEDAFEYEAALINYYVFHENYGISCRNFEKMNSKYYLTNRKFGDEKYCKKGDYSIVLEKIPNKIVVSTALSQEDINLVLEAFLPYYNDFFERKYGFDLKEYCEKLYKICSGEVLFSDAFFKAAALVRTKNESRLYMRHSLFILDLEPLTKETKRKLFAFSLLEKNKNGNVTNDLLDSFNRKMIIQIRISDKNEAYSFDKEFSLFKLTRIATDSRRDFSVMLEEGFVYLAYIYFILKNKTVCLMEYNA